MQTISPANPGLTVEAKPSSSVNAAILCVDEQIMLEIANVDARDKRKASQMLGFAISQYACIGMSGPLPVALDEPLLTYTSQKGEEMGVFKVTGQSLWLIFAIADTKPKGKPI